MKLLGIQKVYEGKVLKNYEIKYLNKKNVAKSFEIVSKKDLTKLSDLGKKPSGVSIFATCNDKMLLLKEFRIGAGKEIYNLCAGTLEEGESIEECINRELYEETGLKIKQVKKLLPPSFAAVAISDVTTYIALVEVEGRIEDHTSDNEQIRAALYSRDEVATLIDAGEPFSSRAQVLAYLFSQGMTI